MRVLSLTGHREQRLNLPTDVSDTKWEPIRNWIRSEIIHNDADIIFTGMASGSDMAIGYEAAKMKSEGHSIKLFCILPCKGYNSKNPNYKFITDLADNIIEIHNEWVKGCDNDRDNYMAEKCDKMLAIYDGIPTGGVYRTIQKCNKYHKPVIYCPKEIVTKYQKIL